MKRLDETLQQYVSKDYYAFHMPGHKRLLEGMKGSNPFSIDITEINGFDNLHHAEGILKEAMGRAATYYGSQHTFYCINGSTAALLSAVSACTTRNGTLLMARNCHKAIYHGVYLRGLEVEYVYPEVEGTYGLNGGITPKSVENSLKQHKKIQAVLITSPTYDGVVSDVGAIARICHKYKVPLIVDEAHGAHFVGSSYFPKQALRNGADVVVHSLHKTLPALTQTSLLHVNSCLVSTEKIQRFLGIYQTSSPSYVLMSSIDGCIGLLMDKGRELFEEYVSNLIWCREQLTKCKYIELIPCDLARNYGIFSMDPSKILLSLRHTNMTGSQFHDIVRETYHLELEMECKEYVLALTSIGDTKEGFERLVQAVFGVEAMLAGSSKRSIQQFVPKLQEPRSMLKIADAMEAEVESIALRESSNRISSEFLYVYPPGIPLIVPGECITQELIYHVETLRNSGLSIQGLQDFSGLQIQVIK